MASTSRYSPVASFKLDDKDATDARIDVLTGYAAPRTGGQPCLVTLSADDRPIVQVRAARHSDAAELAGLRSGWCGFELPGLAQAFAVGDQVRVRCGVSGDVLAEVRLDPALFADRPQTLTTLTASDILAHARHSETSPDVDHILPFARAHFERYGTRPFIEATYMTLLRRWPDQTVQLEPDADLTDDQRIAAFLDEIVEGKEFTQAWGGLIPGPFHPAFRYDRLRLA